MKETIGWLAKGAVWLCGAVLFAHVVSLPYFRPEKPWPEWAILPLILAMAGWAIWPRQRKITLEKAVEEYRAIKNNEERLRLLLDQAHEEQWPKHAQENVARELHAARQEAAEYLESTVAPRPRPKDNSLRNR